MKWRRRKDSPDVIDIRGAGKGGGGRGGGGGGGLQFPGGGGGGGGLPIPGGAGKGGSVIGLIILIVLFLVIRSCGGGSGGFNLPDTSVSAPGSDKPQPIPPSQDPQKDTKDFSVYVFEDVQNTWASTFKEAGDDYSNAKLVLYSGAVDTGGCGSATSAVGPFYCPPDDKVYLDLSFYEEMRKQLGAPGDFAWAYVIAHEMGHHVQDLVGASDGVDTNQESVRLELQADCYAGVWASTAFKRGQLEQGDLEEAQNAAAAVGDDRLQKKAGNDSPDPDSFTHGTSEQRRRWFQTGFDSGDPSSCDTFSPENV